MFTEPGMLSIGVGAFGKHSLRMSEVSTWPGQSTPVNAITLRKAIWHEAPSSPKSAQQLAWVQLESLSEELARLQNRDDSFGQESQYLPETGFRRYFGVD